MKRKISFIVLVISLLFIVTGCDDENENNTIKNYSTDGLNHTSCVRDAYTTDDNTDVDIKIDIYSDDNGYIKLFESVEKITSSDDKVLTEYEESYNKIYSAYKDIKYYDNKVERKDNTVISTTTINYGKVDMKKVLEIEGEEDNVKVVDGKIKLSDWKSFAKKYGTTCK